MDKYENVRRAIDVMTAWTTDPDGDDDGFTDGRIFEYLDEPGGAVALINGLMSLTGQLLVRIEKLSGATINETLQEMARRSL